MAVSAAPKRKSEDQKLSQTSAKAEKAIREVINRGGSTSNSSDNVGSTTAVKNVNVSLTADEIEIIAQLRECRPRDARSTRKTPISQHAWLLEAVHDKIEREKKKYGVV